MSFKGTVISFDASESDGKTAVIHVEMRLDDIRQLALGDEITFKQASVYRETPNGKCEQEKP